MRMPPNFVFSFLWILWVIAQPASYPGPEETWRYQLLEGSQLVDDCPVCDRVPIVVSIRGSFELRLIEEGPLARRYAVTNLEFYTSAGVQSYSVKAAGEYSVGGEVALTQQMSMIGEVHTSLTNVLAIFTNETPIITRSFPMMAIRLNQTNGTITQTFYLQIYAAPIREIWFSTGGSFHAGNLPGPENSVTGGDLLSSTGRIVKRNAELRSKFPDSGEQDLGLDAIDLLPGGEIAFSTQASGGTIRPGDIVFAHMGQVIPQANLLEPIIHFKPAQDYGLDALHFSPNTMPDMRIYFSLMKDLIVFQDPQPNIFLRKGDLLWIHYWELMEGGVFKKNSELLARFHPAVPLTDYGLDAVYIWPSGEIWFSTETGFADAQLGDIHSGDILSDQGYVVYRNLDLLRAFTPLEDLADFGLDALVIISDAAPQTVGDTTLVPDVDLSSGNITLTFKSGGRVFQVERSGSVVGPFEPVSEILSDLTFTDTDVLKTNSQFFYRLRQW